LQLVGKILSKIVVFSSGDSVVSARLRSVSAQWSSRRVPMLRLLQLSRVKWINIEHRRMTSSLSSLDWRWMWPDIAVSQEYFMLIGGDVGRYGYYCSSADRRRKWRSSIGVGFDGTRRFNVDAGVGSVSAALMSVDS